VGRTASGLQRRVVSAVLLAPVVLGALAWGGLATDLLLILTGAGMAFEWSRLAVLRALARQRARPVIAAAVAAVTAGVALFALGLPGWAMAALALGALAAPALAAGASPAVRAWLLMGVVYLGAACIGFLAIRGRPEAGLVLIGWLLALVWATDIGAYAAGKTLGGPKLVRRISPNKTWAGLIGGVASAAAVSALAGWFLPGIAAATGLPGTAGVVLAGGLLALVSQGGDLLESALKRRVGAKDAGGLIPGHGGLLDRADGLAAASLALAAYMTALDAAM
jgi:phosphatidate cytidylyltransferase